MELISRLLFSINRVSLRDFQIDDPTELMGAILINEMQYRLKKRLLWSHLSIEYKKEVLDSIGVSLQRHTVNTNLPNCDEFSILSIAF